LLRGQKYTGNDRIRPLDKHGCFPKGKEDFGVIKEI
jgi:hypothetical protein